MMFYKHIDGQSYTRMDNEYQTFVDLSDLLKTGRAILTAEGPTSPGENTMAPCFCAMKSLCRPGR